MATTSKYYAVGQGKVYIALRNAAGQVGGFEWLGDTDGLTINAAEEKLQFQESFSGNRVTAVDVTTSTDVTFSVAIRNIDGDNLATAYYGESAAVAGATVSGEVVRFFNGKMTALRNPGVSAVTLAAGGTPLVLNTDFTLDAASGAITILPGSLVVAAATVAGVLGTAAYTHSGVASRIKFLTSTAKEYVLRFEGKSQFDNKMQIATLHRAKPGLAAALDLIGTDVAVLTLEGAVLPDASQAVGESAYITYVQV